MLCSMCQHGTTSHWRCLCGESNCRHMLGCSKCKANRYEMEKISGNLAVNKPLTPNEEYEQLQVEWDQFHAERSELIETAESRWKEHWQGLWRERFGKGKGKKKSAEPKATDFPPEEFQAIKQPFLDATNPLCDELDRKMQERRAKQIKLAPHLVFTPQSDCFVKVDSADHGSFHTYGMSAGKYAEESARYCEDTLKRFGFETHLRVESIKHLADEVITHDWSTCTYQLWANIEPKWVDAIHLLAKIDGTEHLIKFCKLDETKAAEVREGLIY